MATEEKVTIEEQSRYLRRMKRRYRQADRKSRWKLLDEMKAVASMHPKSMIRSKKSNLLRESRSREREETNGCNVDDALRVIDERFDHICPRRLTPNLV